MRRETVRTLTASGVLLLAGAAPAWAHASAIPHLHSPWDRVVLAVVAALAGATLVRLRRRARSR